MELEECLRISRQLLEHVGSRAREIQQLNRRKENTAWTKAVKTLLREEGDKREHVCLYSDTKRQLHEFLVDFTWWDCNSKVTVMACESEFGRKPEAIGEDFDKLLSVKAHFKLMIFDSYQEKTRTRRTDQILQTLTRHFREFGQHIKGEIYILLDTADLNDKTRTRIWQCMVPQNGQDATLVFKPVATQTSKEN
jgi:hypothetical protein